jgi:hypothetical protein
MKKKQLVPPTPVGVVALLNLGVVLGQTMPSVWSPAAARRPKALGLKRLREEKLYKPLAETREDFCPTHLKISRTEANRTIHLLDKLGPDYFDLWAQTRISRETYRAVGPAVKDGALDFKGEAIALKPENSRQVTAAVAELRRSTQFLGRNLRITDRIVESGKRSTAIVAEFEEIASDDALLEARLLFNCALSRASDELIRVCARKRGPVVRSMSQSRRLLLFRALDRRI